MTGSDLGSIRVFGLKCAILFVCITPVIYLALCFVASWYGKPIVLDERILIACLAGVTAIMTYGFVKSNGRKD